MSLPTLPPPIDISTEVKKAIIDGVKKVIETFQTQGLLSPAVTYSDVIHEPSVLYDFIQAYRANRGAVDAIVVGADKQPVRDDITPLACGVSLEQIQQLLVKTCAKYFLEKDKVEEEPVIETKTTKRFLFFTKTEQVERKPGPGPDDRRNREILRYLAFDWQLPLLPAMKEGLIYQQVAELGDDFLALRTPAAVTAVASLDPALLKKAKGVAGPDFVNVLLEQPTAMTGIAAWSRDLYLFYRSILGPKAFQFFAREKQFFNVVAELDRPLARIYGDTLCYIASENLQEMQRLNIDKAGVLIESLKAALGDQAPAVLSTPAFAKDILRRLVESLLHMQQEKDALLVSTTLTCKALTPQVLEWLARQQRAA